MCVSFGGSDGILTVYVQATSDDPPFLTVGTEVSAKYRGAFCEATIKVAKKLVKCKVRLKVALSLSPSLSHSLSISLSLSSPPPPNISLFCLCSEVIAWYRIL